MGENKNNKDKILYCITGNTLRDIVNFIREEKLKKEDLWYIDKDRGQYTLLYFK